MTAHITANLDRAIRALETGEDELCRSLEIAAECAEMTPERPRFARLVNDVIDMARNLDEAIGKLRGYSRSLFTSDGFHHPLSMTVGGGGRLKGEELWAPKWIRPSLSGSWMSPLMR